MTQSSSQQSSPNDTYTSPLASRNASPQMLRLWSPRHKFNTWRRIWLAVAEAQHEITKNDPAPLVTQEQVEELRAVVERGITDEEIARAAELERELRHDVMSHVHCLGEICPKAKPIIHLGMTSQDVVCNADMMTIHKSIWAISAKVHRSIVALGNQAAKNASAPSLGFTHYQPAQPVTVGRRIAGWAYELKLAWTQFSDTVPSIRGLKGATGTQASFLSLFNSDVQKIDELEARVVNRLQAWNGNGREPHPLDAEDLRKQREWYLSRSEQYKDVISRLKVTEGIEGLRADRVRLGVGLTHPLTGQTYPRVVDTAILAQLASISSVLHKIATDIRLLSNRKELDEPFEDKQIGSSAMPYKRNPMRCERICGLTRFVMNLVGNAYDTAATQWLERTLDDSSNRRLSLPEAFLALDGALDLMHNVASGLIVNEAMVRKNLMLELPFMATENILMEAVKAGGDRQDLHERIRVHAQAAGHRVKQEGLDNDLLERVKNDPAFAPPALKHELQWDYLMDPMKYVGRSVEQTEQFIKEVVEPMQQQFGDAIAAMEESGPRV
ncbi:MAG: lyase family protein [Phycisphaerales bacterium]